MAKKKYKCKVCKKNIRQSSAPGRPKLTHTGCKKKKTPVRRKKKTRKKKAAIALARKIAVVSWAMLKNKTDWDPKKAGLNIPTTVEERQLHPT